MVSTDIDFISTVALDNLILEFSTNKVPAVPLKMKSAQFNHKNNTDEDSYTLDAPEDDDDWYKEDFDNFS